MLIQTACILTVHVHVCGRIRDMWVVVTMRRTKQDYRQRINDFKRRDLPCTQYIAVGIDTPMRAKHRVAPHVSPFHLQLQQAHGSNIAENPQLQVSKLQAKKLCACGIYRPNMPFR